VTVTAPSEGSTVTVPAGVGRSDYVRFCRTLGLEPDERLSPVARATHLPTWLSGALIATEAASHKLRAWARQTARAAWSEPGDPAAVLVALRAFGDPVMPHEIARALCRVPAPVRDYVLGAVTFVCVGRSFAGWCGAWPEPSTPWLVVLSARDRLEGLVAHEIAHAWLMPEPAAGDRLRSAFAQHAIDVTPLAKVPAAARVDVLAERAAACRSSRAAALLDAWGIQNEF
jgi:hypothetical protein